MDALLLKMIVPDIFFFAWTRAFLNFTASAVKHFIFNTSTLSCLNLSCHNRTIMSYHMCVINFHTFMSFDQFLWHSTFEDNIKKVKNIPKKKKKNIEDNIKRRYRKQIS